ncbi:MAG TPA: transposase [Agriterribacter sp.]|nr:transposase [Agriterribacter sp.]
MPDYHLPLLPGEKYHLFNRAVGNEKLFRNANNYSFFISRFIKHISPVADTYCYCLLPNHFHCMVKIKEEAQLQCHFAEVKWHKPFSPEMLPEFIMERFSNLLNSYAKAYNKMYNRRGGLFIDYLRRKQIETDEQFRATAFYIHNNPVHHGYCTHLSNWVWSSFAAMQSNEPTWLLRKELLDGFGGIEGFQDYHSGQA